MKKVVLIEPQSKEDHVYKTVRMPRLGLPLLGAQLKAAGYQVKLYPDRSVATLVEDSRGRPSRDPTTTATSNEAYRIAGHCSRGLPVIIGEFTLILCLTKRCVMLTMWSAARQI